MPLFIAWIYAGLFSQTFIHVEHIHIAIYDSKYIQ